VAHPLTALFVDCDSYFAAVEQHLDPALCVRPVRVAPVMAETSCCTAASMGARITSDDVDRSRCSGDTIRKERSSPFVPMAAAMSPNPTFAGKATPKPVMRDLYCLAEEP